MAEYFIYVHYSFDKFRVYRVVTDDILHCVGAICYASFLQVMHISFALATEERRKFWADQGITIEDRLYLHSYKPFVERKTIYY